MILVPFTSINWDFLKLNFHSLESDRKIILRSFMKTILFTQNSIVRQVAAFVVDLSNCKDLNKTLLDFIQHLTI